MNEVASNAESRPVQQGSVNRVGVPDSEFLPTIPAPAGFGADSDAPLVRYGFRVGSLAILVPQHIETEVLDNPKVFPLPRAPRWLAGMLNLRGNVVPVFNMRELLGSQTKPFSACRTLVLGRGADAVGIYVDDLPKPVTAKDRAPAAVDLPPALKPFAEPAFSDQGTQWLEFDYTEFFQHLAAGGQDEFETGD